jgi:hypothetical protein
LLTCGLCRTSTTSSFCQLGSVLEHRASGRWPTNSVAARSSSAGRCRLACRCSSSAPRQSRAKTRCPAECSPPRSRSRSAPARCWQGSPCARTRSTRQVSRCITSVAGPVAYFLVYKLHLRAETGGGSSGGDGVCICCKILLASSPLDRRRCSSWRYSSSRFSYFLRSSHSAVSFSWRAWICETWLATCEGVKNNSGHE